jgi:hypothetical protein
VSVCDIMGVSECECVLGGWRQLVRARGGAAHLAALQRIRLVAVAVSQAATAAAAETAGWTPPQQLTHVLQAAQRCDRAWYGDDEGASTATTTAEDEASSLQVR